MNIKNNILSEEQRNKIQEEIKQLVFNNPDAFSILLKNKNNQHLLNFIYTQTTPFLDNPIYSMGTKCYWVINKIKDWSDNRVCCQNCKKPFKLKNVSVIKGYRKYCNNGCAIQHKRKLNQKYDLSNNVDNYRKEMLEIYQNTEIKKIPSILIKKNYLVKAAIDFAPECIKNHSEATKRYWFMNNIKEFPKCATCNMPITKNVINAKHGYTLRNDESRNQIYCCSDCAKKSQHYIDKQLASIFKRFGEIKSENNATLPQKPSLEKIRKIKYQKIIDQNFVIPAMSEEEFSKFKIRQSIIHHQKIKWICCRCGHHFYSQYYKYDKYIYKHLKVKVHARCPICFPRCNTSSLEERKLAEWISSLSNDLEVVHSKHYNWHVIYPFQLDILVFNKKINQKFAIEYNGVHWHSIQIKGNKNTQLIKTTKCEQLKIPLIHIYEDEWIKDKLKIKNFLKQYLLNGFVYTKRIPKYKDILELPHDKYPLSTVIPGWKLKTVTKAKLITRKNLYSNTEYLVYDCGQLIFERA